MDTLIADVRFALRQFRKRPLFILVVVVTLALGIGGNAAIFTVADQVLLQPLPYAAPDELVRVYTQFPNLELRQVLDVGAGAARARRVERLLLLGGRLAVGLDQRQRRRARRCASPPRWSTPASSPPSACRPSAAGG